MLSNSLIRAGINAQRFKASMVNSDLVVKSTNACCVPVVGNWCGVQQFVDMCSLDNNRLSESAFQQVNGDSIVGCYQLKSSDGYSCSSPDKTTQIQKFVNTRKALVCVNRALVAVPKFLPFLYLAIEMLYFYCSLGSFTRTFWFWFVAALPLETGGFCWGLNGLSGFSIRISVRAVVRLWFRPSSFQQLELRQQSLCRWHPLLLQGFSKFLHLAFLGCQAALQALLWVTLFVVVILQWAVPRYGL